MTSTQEFLQATAGDTIPAEIYQYYLSTDPTCGELENKWWWEIWQKAPVVTNGAIVIGGETVGVIKRSKVTECGEWTGTPQVETLVCIKNHDGAHHAAVGQRNAIFLLDGIAFAGEDMGDYCTCSRPIRGKWQERISILLSAFLTQADTAV